MLTSGNCSEIWNIVWGQAQEWIKFSWVWWSRPILHFFYFFGLAEMPSADRKYPKNTRLHWKKWYFFSLIFKLKSFNLWNTISIQSNISSPLAVKTHICSRYSSRVTNCWSPEHIFIRKQKLDPEFDKPTGILVNLYNPDDPAWNVDLWIYVSTASICRLPCAKVEGQKPLTVMHSL